jgi:hypothetical protein
MSGIQMALLGASGTAVIVGQTTYVSGGFTFYYYGYNNSTGGGVLANFGDIDNGKFKDVTIKAIHSFGINVPGQAIQYVVYFDGNRSAGFFNTLTINGTLVTGTLGSPNYNATYNETSFTITLASAAPTLFGTTNGVRIPTVLT